MRVVAITLFFLLSAVCTLPAQGQSTLTEKQKAVIIFDVRMDMIMKSELAKELGFANNLQQMAAPGAGADPSKVDRVFGAMSAPESLEQLQAMQNGSEVKFEFFSRMKYKDAASAKADFESNLNDDFEEIERAGKTYFKSPGTIAVPKGLVMHMVDETTIEMATEAYAFHSDRKVFTDNLMASWKQAPNDAIRIAADLAGAKEFVAELVKEAKDNAPDPTVGEYLGLIDNIKDLRLSLDFSNKNLLTLNANGVDQENTDELKGGLDSLFFLAKAAGKPSLKQMQERAPELAKVGNAVLDSLEAKTAGTNVSVSIPRPEGLVEAIKKASGMMMGMGGGPPAVRPPGDGF